jgi:8-oxo-dGTP pyrophosphatase MutT (NUDIX family)
VSRSEGDQKIFYVVHQNPFVIIVAVTDEQEIVLVGQHRYTSKAYSLEFPAGGCECSDPLNDGRRELHEETGFIASSWDAIGTLQIANGSMQQSALVLLAQDLHQTGHNKQAEDGIIEVRTVRFQKLMEMIIDCQLTDSDTISAAMLAGLKLGWLRHSNTRKTDL